MHQFCEMCRLDSIDPHSVLTVDILRTLSCLVSYNSSKSCTIKLFTFGVLSFRLATRRMLMNKYILNLSWLKMLYFKTRNHSQYVISVT